MTGGRYENDRRKVEQRSSSSAARLDAAPFNLAELLRDCESCARLSDWEQDFTDDLRGRMLLNGGQLALSEKQMAKLRQIEAKVYAVG
jgi:hypothetical protein